MEYFIFSFYILAYLYKFDMFWPIYNILSFESRTLGLVFFSSPIYFGLFLFPHYILVYLLCYPAIFNALKILIKEKMFEPSKIGHFHHDHTHLFGQNDHIVTGIVPFGHFLVKFALLGSECFHLRRDLLFLFLRDKTISVLNAKKGYLILALKIIKCQKLNKFLKQA